MIVEKLEEQPGARLLLNLACAVVVVYGLRYASAILLPAAVALFLSVLSLPIMLWLQRHRVPGLLRIVIPVVLNIAVFGLLILLATRSLVQFQGRVGIYAAELDQLQAVWIQALEARTELPVSTYIGTAFVDPSVVANFARGLVGRAAELLGTTFLVFLIMAFMLSEASVFPEKFRYIMRGGVPGGRPAKVVTEVQAYVGIKTVVSLATGLLLGLWCWVMDLDFPVLLGVLAFLLHFIPTVGAIFAAVPAVMLSLILVGTVGHALAVALGYAVVGTLLGHILEPQLQGRQLGLSPLVLVLSLLFWGWAWGPMGALLAVPLTVVVKIWLENTPDLRWVAILLDKAPPRTDSESPTDVPSGV